MNEKQLLHITRIEVDAGPDPHINTIALWDDGTYDILFTEDCNIPYGEKTVKLGGRKGLKSASGNITRDRKSTRLNSSH